MYVVHKRWVRGRGWSIRSIQEMLDRSFYLIDHVTIQEQNYRKNVYKNV